MAVGLPPQAELPSAGVGHVRELSQTWSMQLMSAVEVRAAAKAYKAEAGAAGTATKKVTLLTNIAHTLGGLASQLEMLDDYERQNRQK